jgi:hypothetical protein
MKSSVGFGGSVADDKSVIHGGVMGIGGTIINLENINIACY